MKKNAHHIRFLCFKQLADWVLLGLVICLHPLPSIGQNSSCQNQFLEANQTFQKGNMARVPDLILPCLESKGFDRRERIEVYDLLTRVYLILDQKEKAKQSLLNILKIDPEYQISAEEVEMRVLYQAVKIKPWGYVSFMLGSNLTQVNFFDASTATGVGYHSSIMQLGYRPGFQSAISQSWRIIGGLETALEGSFVQYEWQRQAFISTLSYGMDNNFLNITNREKLTYMQVSWLWKYRLFPNPDDYQNSSPRLRKLFPYMYAGFTGSWLANGQIFKPQRKTLAGPFGQETAPVIDGFAVDSKDLRYPWNLGLTAGVGLSTKVGKGFIGLDFRISTMLRQTNDPSQRYLAEKADELLFTYGYLDENFQLGHGFLSLIYDRPLYRPRFKK